MRQDFFYPSADGKNRIHALEWLPEGTPKATLQLCHGMAEYIARYDAFAAFLAARGWYVTGNDHLGHGQSAASAAQLGFFAQPKGNECVIADIHALRQRTDARYPGLPRFMLGHSMGSFLLRQYITQYGEGLSGAIVMGTGAQPGAVLKAGKAICRTAARFHGWEYRSGLMNSMAFGSYNKRFEPARTPGDWLSRNEASVDAYNADPLCGFVFTVNGYYHMFRGIEAAQKPENIARIPKTLPLLLVSGANDPVGGFGAGVQQVFESYRAAGLSDVQMKLYPEDRHEILNELDRETVFADLAAWLEARS